MCAHLHTCSSAYLALHIVVVGGYVGQRLSSSVRSHPSFFVETSICYPDLVLNQLRLDCPAIDHRDLPVSRSVIGTLC